MLPLGDPSQFQRQTQAQSERTEDDTSCKWYPKESECNHTS